MENEKDLLKNELVGLEKKEELEQFIEDAELLGHEDVVALAQEKIAALGTEKTDIESLGSDTLELAPELEQNTEAVNQVHVEAQEKIKEIEAAPEMEEELKTPLGLTQETQEILQNKLPELLVAAESGDLSYRQAESIGLALALNGDVSKIGELLASESIEQYDKNDIAKEAIRVFADVGNPVEAENLLDYLSIQKDYESNSGDAFNKEKMFSSPLTNLQRNVAQSYINSGQPDGANNVVDKMMKGIDRDVMEERVNELRGKSSETSA